MKRSLARLTLLIFLYSLIAIGSIYPASIDLDGRIVGGGELGGWLWRYWWMKLELEALLVEMADYPLQLFLHIISLGRFPETGNMADLYGLSYPLELIFGAPAYYNIKCMFIVVTNGLAGYALSRAFTPSRFLAFVGGAVLAMNSFVALEIFQSGLRQAILSPGAMAVLSLERLLTRGKLRDGFSTGIWFALCAGFYWFYGLFLFLYAVMRGLVAIPSVVRSPRRWEFVFLLFEAAGIAAGLAAVFAYPYIFFKLDHTGQLPEVQFLTDFPTLEVLQAATDHPRTLEENLMASLKRVLHSSWSLDYLWNPVHPRNVTLAVLVFSVGGCVLALKRSWFWLIAFVFFWLHTGGPYLMEHYNPGERVFVEMDGSPVRLLYAYTFKFVPMMSRLFAPYRAGGFVWITLTVLTVLSLETLRVLVVGGLKGLKESPRPTPLIYLNAERPQLAHARAPSAIEAPAQSPALDASSAETGTEVAADEVGVADNAKGESAEQSATDDIADEDATEAAATDASATDDSAEEAVLKASPAAKVVSEGAMDGAPPQTMAAHAGVETVQTPLWRQLIAPIMASIFLAAFLGQQFGDHQVLEYLRPDTAGSLGRGLPVNSSTVRIHPFYHALAKEEGHLGIVELPMFVQQDLITYYQVVHEKKVMQGWAMPGALPPYLRFVKKPKSEKTELLQYLTEPDTAGPNSFVDAMVSLSKPPYRLGEYGKADLHAIGERGFRYIVLHERGCYMLWPGEGRALYEALRRRLTRELGQPAEVVEVVNEEDAEWEKLLPHTGLLGNWASSAIPISGSERPTRYHMSIFLVPKAGWGEAWVDAVTWQTRVATGEASGQGDGFDKADESSQGTDIKKEKEEAAELSEEGVPAAEKAEAKSAAGQPEAQPSVDAPPADSPPAEAPPVEAPPAEAPDGGSAE